MKKLFVFVLALSLIASGFPAQQVLADDLPAVPALTISGPAAQKSTGDVDISWTTFGGGGGLWWFVEEDEKKVYEAAVDFVGSGAQAGSVQLTNRPSGLKEYKVFLCNDVGCTESANTLKVDIDNPTYYDRIQAPRPAVIDHMKYNNTSGEYTISWNMWGGPNGDWWELHENDEIVHQEDLVNRGAEPQSGSVRLTGRRSGEYEYVVVLCNQNIDDEVICVPSPAKTITVKLAPSSLPAEQVETQLFPLEPRVPEKDHFIANPFSDLIASDDHYDASLRAYADGWFRGNADGTARLDDSINRADFVSMVLKAFDVPLRELPYGMSTFRDVEPGAWFETALFTASRNGMISCCGDYDFRPWDDLIKAEALRMVLDLAAFDYSLPEPQYSDVGVMWYSGYASFSRRLNLIDPDEEGRLHPFGQMTRGEAVELISRVLALR